MARSVIFLVFCALFALTFAESNIQVVNDINDFIHENPRLKFEQIVPFQRLQYTFGRHLPGDRVLNQGNGNANYNTFKDVKVNLKYPARGIGGVVTFVDIQVDSNGANTYAYIVSGGIGHRNITIVLESRRATRFSYSATFYGH